ncbi:MAG: peptide deformylase [Planctomycetota bacterium]|jgi:peptide deformylase
MELDIVYYTDPRLTRPTSRVAEVTAEIAEAVEAMFEVMYRERGIGLAATQVGLTHRLFVMNLAGREGAGMEHVIINPEILQQSKDLEEVVEGCLSFPGITGHVARPRQIVVRYQDLQGDVHEVEADDLFARCVQHETDHLDGLLMVERFTPADQIGLKRKLKDLAKKVADGTVPSDARAAL